MDSSTQHANGAAPEGETGPEFTPLRRTAVPAGVVEGEADSVPRCCARGPRSRAQGCGG